MIPGMCGPVMVCAVFEARQVAIWKVAMIKGCARRALNRYLQQLQCLTSLHL